MRCVGLMKPTDESVVFGSREELIIDIFLCLTLYLENP